MAAAPIKESPDLLARAIAGDRAAFARLVETHYDFIFRVAWRWSGSREDGEDIAQEVCVRLAGALRGWRGDAAFRTWLYTMTMNAARDHGRKMARQMILAKAVHVQALVDAAEPLMEDPAEALWAAVRALPEKQRDAVLLVHGEGLSHGAAASVMGCSESTVSWHIHEARKRLKKMLDRAQEAGGSHD
ncbi:MAG: RNA polymerase sigma factor [Nitratireductor sp.]|nr:RNA polymerase sigma factor [Nitratireductor sp.]